MITDSGGNLFSLSQKVALTRDTFLAYILPPILCFYLMGVLVQLKGTAVYRVALLPCLLWLAWRGAFVDMSGGDPKRGHMNTALMTPMFCAAMRGTIWACVKETYHRDGGPSKKSVNSSPRLSTTLWNALDLMYNARGIGWNWWRGPVVPKPVIDTDSRILFALWSTAQFIFFAVCLDVAVQLLRIWLPETVASLDGGPLFDNALPSFQELLHAVWISFLTIWILYFSLQCGYLIPAIVCTIVFQHHPSQWPPIFDSPWLSTSLSDLWGRRWHQLLREQVLVLGVRPLSALFGRCAGLLGAFIFSGILHDVQLRAFGRGGNSVIILGFWAMNGVGVVLEHVWKKCTGRRVGGILGWAWTFGWLALWGIPMVNEWAKAGQFGLMTLQGEFRPSIMLVRACLALVARK